MIGKKMKMLRLPILIETDEDGYYIVSCPPLKGCHSYGTTIEEAMDNIKEVIHLCLEETNTTERNTFVGFREVEISQNA